MCIRDRRKEAYLETMKKYGLPVTPGMIAQGDYSEFVDKQVECLLDSNPDAQAIVFANDEMAFAGYRVCEKRGLVVGKDIMITGFDDCERASGMEPPLTTIQQDGELMGKMAVYDLSLIHIFPVRVSFFEISPVLRVNGSGGNAGSFCAAIKRL